MSRGRATTAVAAAGRTAAGPITGGRGTTARGRAARAGGLLVLALAQLLVPFARPAGAAAPGWTTPAAVPGWAAPAYETAPDARPVKGATAVSKAPPLEPGTYTDTISAGERKYYQVDLDATSNAYVSAVLAPPPGSEVAGTDGIRVTLESADREQCSDSTDITFGGATARPVADYSTRRIGRGRACQEAGPYLYTVEWIDSKSGTDAESWPVELKFMSEPGLKDGETAPSAPSSWSSRPPGETSGEARTTGGGTGFNDAPAVGRGVWRDRLGPGESRFYKVPVDWGQQLFLDAEFGGSGSGAGAPTVADGLRLSLFNTARGFVESADAAASGSSAKASLATAPVAFANRTSDEANTGAMRFAGWYYVRVSVDERAGNPLPLTLRVAVEGEARPGPAYAGDEFAAGFGVSDEDRQAAAVPGGGVRDTDGSRATMRVIGLSGIGTGTVLVLGLVVWTLGSRRRASAWEPPAH
ncbi:hypothetical protein ACFYT4_10380 [Streptomyces sp. NPDC004609]|uniref:hypothetical protein n=1 Tax=Streptomyces sp. NPDC004609 TaxID=3364704 RepID=UPI0036B92B86